MNDRSGFRILFLPVFFACSLFIVISAAYSASGKEQEDLSQRCARQTAKIFAREYPTPTWKMPDGKTWSIRYERHFNTRLSKCYMLIRTVLVTEDKSVLYSYLLTNVDENREIGEYLDFNKSDVTCYLLSATCKSRSEWDALAEPCMSE